MITKGHRRTQYCERPGCDQPTLRGCAYCSGTCLEAVQRAKRAGKPCAPPKGSVVRR